jgi:PPOX class probable F420-dependent enzyme
MATLSDQVRELIDAPEFATLATIDDQGRPQLSVVWIKTDGDDVLVSTTTSRLKYREIAKDPRVSLLVYPKDQPYV